MSALSFPVGRKQAIAALPILHDSLYELDSEHSRTLLAITCSEQPGRLHNLMLLCEYLASGAGGRKRQLAAKELQALKDLYEAVWCELGYTFDAELVRFARTSVERSHPEWCGDNRRGGDCFIQRNRCIAAKAHSPERCSKKDTVTNVDNRAYCFLSFMATPFGISENDRMVCRNTVFGAHVTEHAALLVVFSAHSCKTIKTFLT